MTTESALGAFRRLVGDQMKIMWGATCASVVSWLTDIPPRSLVEVGGVFLVILAVLWSALSWPIGGSGC